MLSGMMVDEVMRIRTVTNPGFDFFLNNVFCVSDAENQKLS